MAQLGELSACVDKYAFVLAFHRPGLQSKLVMIEAVMQRLWPGL